MTRAKRLVSMCLVFILVVAAVPATASAANPSVGIFTVFSTLNGASSSIQNVGHSWISFKNISPNDITVGSYVVKPMEEVTIGRWPESDHYGIWYNLDSEKINFENDMNGRVSYSLEISMTDVYELTKAIEENDNYNSWIFVGEHCSEFAHTAWSRVDSTIDGPFGYSSPKGLMDVIKTKPGYETNRGVQYPRLIMYKDGSDSNSYYPSLQDASSRYVGKTIALKSLEANQYVSSNTDQDTPGINATVNRSSASTWEYFDVIAGDYGVVGFKARGNGNYLSTRIDQNKNYAYIQAAYGQTYSKPQSWESFRIFEKDGIQYIQSQANGKWMQAAVNETDNPLKAAGAHASTWERFQIEIVNPSTGGNTGDSGGGNTGGTGGNTGGGTGGGSGTTRVSQYYHGTDYNEGWYEGEWSNGHPNGYGKLTYDDFGDGKYYALIVGGSDCKAIYYEGQFSNGWRYGSGTVVYENDYKDEGTFYGQWQAGKVVFEGKRWHGNGYWPWTITATSATTGKDDHGDWVSVPGSNTKSYTVVGDSYVDFTYKESPAFSLSFPSVWAQESIVKAYDMDLIPEYMMRDYSLTTTRIDFVKLAYNAIENKCGWMQQVLFDEGLVDNMERGPSVVFTDVTESLGYNNSDRYRVAALRALGIITGVGDNMFEPNRAITRQEAATLLSRVHSFIRWGEVKEYTYGETDNKYTDNHLISEWAFYSVYNMRAIDVMNGVGNNVFNPQGAYTIEQSIVTFVRLLGISNRECFPPRCA